MERYQQKDRARQRSQRRSRFVSRANVTVGPFTATARRLTDLSLAMVIPWRDYSQVGMTTGWPQWWMNDENESERMQEILDATEDEVLPWEM